MTLFDRALSVPAEEIQILLHGHVPVLCSDFKLNRRRIRGSDFLMRWSLGVWSKERLVSAVNETGGYFALPYGPRSVAPDEDFGAFELYFERLENSAPAGVNRPDLLIFRELDREAVSDAVERIGGEIELPFTPERHADMRLLLSRAILAVECGNSLSITGDMPDYDAKLKPMKRLGGKPGLRKNAVLPTLILEEEDRLRLWTWQKKSRVGVHLWHVFFDTAFGLPLAEAQRLIDRGLIGPTEEVFQAPSGATAKKVIYEIYRQYAYPLASSMEAPELRANFIEDKNGHILPYVKFVGGSLSLGQEAVSILSDAAQPATLAPGLRFSARGA
ncbi:MAG: AccI family restriction endonuclease [Candidatus Brocadiia bacterium]